MIPARILGRHAILDDIIWLSSSGSSISFSCKKCSKGTIILHGDASATDPSKITCRARYALYLDGLCILCDVMDTEEKRIPLPFGTEGEAELRIVKLSEASQSNLGVSFADFDGELTPSAEKKTKIEFIGDSITCGYGVDGNLSMIYSTMIEDVRRAWAWQAAEQLDADGHFTCFSGFGIFSGYTGDGVRNTGILVPDYYEKVGFCDQPIPGHEKVNDLPWDFSFFQPDAIVINLGTNDISYCGTDPARQEEYRLAYIDFLKTVRRRNPEAEILCILGLMGTVLNDTMVAAVKDYIAETGDQHIRSHPVAEQKAEDGYVPDYHPSPLSQKMLAEEIAAVLKNEIL